MMTEKEKEECFTIIRAMAILIIKDIVSNALPNQKQEDIELQQQLLREIFFDKTEKERNTDDLKSMGYRYLEAMEELHRWVCQIEGNYNFQVHEIFQEKYSKVLFALYEMGQNKYPSYSNEEGQFRLKHPSLIKEDKE
jgi:hypothetical protein